MNKIQQLLRQFEGEDRRSIALRAVALTLPEARRIMPVVNVIGLEKTLLVLSAFSGERIFLPKFSRVLEGIVAAGAVVAVLQKRLNKKNASRHYQQPIHLVTRGLQTLERYERYLQNTSDQDASSESTGDRHLS